MRRRIFAEPIYLTGLVVAVFGLSLVSLGAQTPQTPAQTASGAATANPVTTPPPAGVTPPPDYVIGPDDVLTVVFWRDKEMSGDVAVRPDGKITLPLINEITAAGLTPTALRESIVQASKRFMEDPNVSVIVKAINSRKVYITGQVGKPGPYPLLEPTTVLQLIAKAGGLSEYADKKNIVIVRAEKRPDGTNWSFKVNYQDLLDRKNLKQNIELKPGDTVIVP